MYKWEWEVQKAVKEGWFKGGVGNPPCESIKLQEEEHWAGEEYIA